MNSINEPADGGYVAVQYRSDPPSVLVYRRDDQRAAAFEDPAEHWFCLAEQFDRPMTWEALLLTGPLAYVGELREGGPVSQGKAWGSL